jgi:carboxypeptidase C (cathepsin A)
MTRLPAVRLTTLLLLVALAGPASAQPRPADAEPHDTGAETHEHGQRSAPQPLPANSETHHTLTLPGRSLPFTATAGSVRMRDAQGMPQADIAYIVYALDGADPQTRPVTFVFNGGPGASTAWLQLGAVGPWRLPIDGTALAPSAPPVVAPNADTWLDFTDLVFIDPPGAGFSRFATNAEDVRKRLWSVDGDVDLLAAVIRRLTVQTGRATSPKFILAESYGGIRGPRLVRALQTGQGIGIEGLLLVSPLLDRGGRSKAFDPLNWVTHLPSMVAAARAANGPVDRAALADAEAYASGPYLADLLRGAQDQAALARIVAHVATLTGLDPAIVAEHGGRIDNPTFLRERQRRAGEVGSFYDATIFAPDPFPWSTLSNHPDLVLDGLRAPLTGAMLELYARELRWLPDQGYEVINGTVAHNWDWGRGNVESVGALRNALALDRHFRVLIAHGMTDLMTPYFATQLILNQLPPAVGGDRVRLEVYPGGHMFYARDASRQAFRAAAQALYLPDARP